MAGLVGKTIGKYEVAAELGRGGMATVYKAYQPSLERFVALKVMLPEMIDDDDFISRFQREAAAIARLRHPHIVQVYDFDTDDGLYYMVMEYVDGPTLRAELKARNLSKGLFSLSEVVRICTDLAGAIDYAHSQGMIHRDLKPGNVMINRDGQVVLTDFGIARLLDRSKLTMTGSVMGTPAYMSPEQGQGQSGDTRSDIYSLGVVLYEMITGRIPYEADTPIAMIMQHITAPLPRPSVVNAAIPSSVEDVVLKTLSKSPDDRYQSAGQMAYALRRAVGVSANKIVSDIPTAMSNPSPPDPTSTAVDLPAPSSPSKAQAAPVQPAPPKQPPPQPKPPAYEPLPEPPKRKARPQSAPTAETTQRPKMPLVIGGLFLLMLCAAALAFAGIFGNGRFGQSRAVVAAQTATVSSLQTRAADLTWREQDDDGDGLKNGQEQALNTNPAEADTDGDGLSDGDEVNQGSNPLVAEAGDDQPDDQVAEPTTQVAPTATLVATPTSPPAAIATLTPTSSPTGVETETPTSNQDCSISPADTFADVWESLREQLGCPLEERVVIPTMAEEAFEGGHMFWRSDIDLVYIIYDRDKGEGTNLLSGEWITNPDWIWDGSNPDGIGLTPPPGLVEPTRGFGWLWRTHLGAQDGPMGWALDREYGFDNVGQSQQFEAGLIFRGSFLKTYVLLDDGTFVAR